MNHLDLDALDKTKPYVDVRVKKVVTLLGVILLPGDAFSVNTDSKYWDESLDANGVSAFMNNEVFDTKKVEPARDTSKVQSLEVVEEEQTVVDSKPSAPKRRNTTRK